MKKLIVLVFCVLTLHSFSKDLIPITFLGGIGASTICGGESWKDPVGLQVNVEARILEINEKSFINTGLGFSLQGAGWEEPEYNLDGRVRLAYLNIPVLYTYVCSAGFYGEIGLQPGILLSAKDIYDGNSEDYKHGVKSFDLGLPFGAGYNVNEQLSVGLRATYGITNLDNTGSDVSDHNFIVVALVKLSLNKLLNK